VTGISRGLQEAAIGSGESGMVAGRTIPRAVAAGVQQSLWLRTPDGLMRAGPVLLGVGAAIPGALTARDSVFPA
jgi:hypothetical protein